VGEECILHNTCDLNVKLFIFPSVALICIGLHLNLLDQFIDIRIFYPFFVDIIEKDEPFLLIFPTQSIYYHIVLSIIINDLIAIHFGTPILFLKGRSPLFKDVF